MHYFWSVRSITKINILNCIVYLARKESWHVIKIRALLITKVSYEVRLLNHPIYGWLYTKLWNVMWNISPIPEHYYSLSAIHLFLMHENHTCVTLCTPSVSRLLPLPGVAHTLHFSVLPDSSYRFASTHLPDLVKHRRSCVTTQVWLMT